jgi:NAD(P)-dependent dehydrogenase (short-subunit alcohol dehydrogenase family)
MVDTPMTAGLERQLNRYALQRIADPLEIAQAILFLSTTESSFITGAALAVDGGRTFH